MIPDGDPGRAELAEWLAYLRQIGVRELRVAAPASGPAAVVSPVGPRAARGPADGAATGAPPLRGGERPRAARSEADPQVGAAAPERGEPTAQGTLGLADGFPAPPPADPAARLTEIRADLGDCTRCKLHGQRTNIVFGVGNPRARLMFVGEGPGAEEDARGEPFVGRAGKKLDEMISAIGLRRQDVYIANIVKCRPPNNRDPERDEVETCSPFLVRQIEAIRPRVIVTLGAPSTRTLLRTREGITRLRGTWHGFRGIPVMPTFHPAYLLRAYTIENRRMVFEDLKAARARMDDRDS